jgi:hypothetical protein
MRLISVKSTQLQWLPVLANIAPPKLRREATTVREVVNCRRHAIKGCSTAYLCGILIHIRLQRFFQFLMSGLRHGQHCYLSTVI